MSNQFRYEDAPTPVAGAGEVLVKIEASGLNPVDLYVRQGYLAKNVPLEFPAIIGLDAAGTVAEVGAGVTGFNIGDRVVAKAADRQQGSACRIRRYDAGPTGETCGQCESCRRRHDRACRSDGAASGRCAERQGR